MTPELLATLQKRYAKIYTIDGKKTRMTRRLEESVGATISATEKKAGHVAKLPKLIPSDYGNINRKTRAVPVPYDIREAIIAELKERPARTWPLADSINRSRVYVATIVTKLHSEGVINRANRKDEWRVV